MLASSIPGTAQLPCSTAITFPAGSLHHAIKGPSVRWMPFSRRSLIDHCLDHEPFGAEIASGLFEPGQDSSADPLAAYRGIG